MVNVALKYRGRISKLEVCSEERDHQARDVKPSLICRFLYAKLYSYGGERVGESKVPNKRTLHCFVAIEKTLIAWSSRSPAFF